MTISVVGSTTGSSVGAGPDSTITINSFAGTNGHLLLASIFRVTGSQSVSTCTPPAGWTLLHEGTSGAGQLSIFSRTCNAEPGSYVFTLTQTTVGIGGIIELSTDLSSDDWAILVGAGTAALSSVSEAGASLTASDIVLLLHIGAASHGNPIAASTSSSPPSGMTEQFDINYFILNSVSAQLECSFKTQSAGATGAKIATITAAHDTYGVPVLISDADQSIVIPPPAAVVPYVAPFDDVQFPPAISFGSTGGPHRQTQIAILGGGDERRNARWFNSRRSYDVGYLHSVDDVQALIQFFEARDSRLIGFRFKDWADYKSCAPLQAVRPTDQAIGTGDGAIKTFQLVKVYTSGSRSYTRTIIKPVWGTVRVALAGAEQLSGWNVDRTTGIVTFTAAPGVGVAVAAGFEFDVPARFDMDKLEVDLSHHGAAKVASCLIVELPPP